MRRDLPAVVPLLLCACLAPSLRAQVPGERATLDSIRARFEAVDDSSALIALERQRIAVARTDRDNPFIHMELGYLAYRLGELTGAKKRYQDAASEFQWAADLRPQWPYAWYYLGTAELLTGESDLIIVENLRQILGQDALSQAARSFARAVEADPSFGDALVDLANTAMRQRIAPRLAVAQSALRQAAGTPAGRIPGVQLMRGRIERRLDAFDSALVAFRLYVAVGGDSVIGGVEQARTLALLGRPDSSVAAYFGAVAHRVSDTARAEVRRDLRWFAEPDELAVFDAVPADSVGLWLRRFWFGRDLEDGRRVGERMVEQFRRYQYAVENFALPSKRRGFDVSFAYQDTTQQEFDDRGVIYLRHGEPSERTTYTATGYDPNESWIYRRDPPQTDLIVHFVAINDVQDYRLVQSLAAVCRRRHSADALVRGSGLSTRRARAFEDMPIGVADTAEVHIEQNCVQTRAGFSDVYERLSRVGIAPANTWATERTATVSMAHEATTSDSYALHFDHRLRPVVSSFAIGDEQRRPELHLVFAVPVARLHALDVGGVPAFAINLRLLVYDSTSRLVAALDTLRVFRSPARAGASAWLTEQVALHVPPGQFRYSFVIEETNASAGDAVSNREIEVPRLDGGFNASDVVVGREGSGLVWRRPEGAIALNPLMRFPRDGEASLYYELYGLPQGAQVGTQVRVVPLGGRSIFRRLFGGRGGADLSYTTVTDAPGRTRVRQTLNLRGLSPGRYRLEVSFTDPVSGRRIVRESPFQIDGQREP